MTRDQERILSVRLPADGNPEEGLKIYAGNLGASEGLGGLLVGATISENGSLTIKPFYPEDYLDDRESILPPEQRTPDEMKKILKLAVYSHWAIENFCKNESKITGVEVSVDASIKDSMAHIATTTPKYLARNAFDSETVQERITHQIAFALFASATGLEDIAYRTLLSKSRHKNKNVQKNIYGEDIDADYTIETIDKLTQQLKTEVIAMDRGRNPREYIGDPRFRRIMHDYFVAIKPPATSKASKQSPFFAMNGSLASEAHGVAFDMQDYLFLDLIDQFKREILEINTRGESPPPPLPPVARIIKRYNEALKGNQDQ